MYAPAPRKWLGHARTIAVGLGICLTLVAFAGDLVAPFAARGFGQGQLLLLLAGVALVLVGLLGMRTLSLYRASAMILLNTIVAFGLLELAAVSAEKLEAVRAAAEPRFLAKSPYYASQPWAKDFWREWSKIETGVYRPYILWRRPEIAGKTVNVGRDNIRRTPGADCRSGSYRVFAFGGSALWGAGVPDWGTIPAYLQAALSRERVTPICVVNFAEPAFVSTQSLIQLIQQLRAGNVPNLAIFYDGYNDVYAAHLTGQPGVHFFLRELTSRYEATGAWGAVVLWAQSLRSLALLRRAVGPDTSREQDALSQNGRARIDSLADATTRVYLGNYAVVAALARHYGFEHRFFVQPVVSVGRKPLTAEERRYRSDMSPAVIALYAAVYQRLKLAARQYGNLHYLADAFERRDSLTWLDMVHITPEGNQLIARRMLTAID